MKNLPELVKKAKQETKWWSYAAWTLPFVALSIITFEHFVGWETWYGKTVIVVSVTFFTISVYWWWWALNKFVQVLRAMEETDKHFDDIKDTLRETREVIEQLKQNDSNR